MTLESVNNIIDLAEHVVICNCNEKVGGIVGELHEGTNHEPLDVVLVIQDEKLWRENPEWHPGEEKQARFHKVFGCPSDDEVLELAGIKHARAAVILADPNHGDLADAPSALIAMAIEKQNPRVHTVIELIAAGNRQHIDAVDINEIICIGEISEKLIVQSCITPGIKNIFDDLLTFREGTAQIYVVFLPENLAGRSFREICRMIILSGKPFVTVGYVKNEILMDSEELKTARADEWSDSLIPHFRAGEKECTWSRIVINPKSNREPGKDTVLTGDDQLVFIGHEQPDLGFLSET